MVIARTQSITNGQIGQINDRLATKLRESGLPMKEVQAVLTAPGGEVIDEMIVALRRRVEAISETIVREVEVDYDLKPREAISATKRAEHLNNEVVDAMPCNGKGKKRVKVCFFPLHRLTSVGDFQKALDERGLVPDPRAVASVNEYDPQFGDSYPNGTQWIDSLGRHCYLTFGRWHDERYVYCGRFGHGWNDRWWGAGVPRK